MKRGKNISRRGRGRKETEEKRRTLVEERKVVRKEKMSGDLIGRHRMRRGFFSSSFSSLLSTRREKGRLRRIVGYGSIGLLSLILLSFLFPLAPSTSQAVTADSSNPITDGAKLKAETYVYSTLAISLSESVNLDVVPKAGGSFTTGGAKLAITTNNTTGYAVYLQTGDNTSTLRPANGMVEAEIKPVVGEMNESNFQQNLDSWGYAIGQADASLSSMNYKAVPMASDPAVITTDSLAASDSYTLGFAASVSPSLPAGKYYNSVLVSVVANPIAIHTLSGITYMQEMSPYVCDYSDEHETKQLIDTRDGKSYWVAKLKDGNCWMTQNLALDLSTEVALTPEDSDVSANWTPESSTNEVVFSPSDPFSEYNNNQYSWNLGKIVLATPLANITCSNYGGDGFDSATSNDNLSDVCRTSGFINVSSEEWSPVLVAGTGIFDEKDQVILAVDESAHTYDAHYLIGNYYQANTATAGSDANISGKNQNAKDSICPRNWSLPVAASNDDAFPIANPSQTTKSIYQLSLAYGYPEANSSTYTVTDGSKWGLGKSAYMSLKNTDANVEGNLMASPLYFAKSGFVSRNYLRRAGSSLYLRTKSSYSDSPFFDSYVEGNRFRPAGTDLRIVGIPVRCVAK